MTANISWTHWKLFQIYLLTWIIWTLIFLQNIKIWLCNTKKNLIYLNKFWHFHNYEYRITYSLKMNDWEWKIYWKTYPISYNDIKHYNNNRKACDHKQLLYEYSFSFLMEIIVWKFRITLIKTRFLFVI